ncbi:MAG: hypothetical protein QW461_10755 [Candidatus Jordarchaeales archaeon]
MNKKPQRAGEAKPETIREVAEENGVLHYGAVSLISLSSLF